MEKRFGLISVFVVLTILTEVDAQMPGFGGCPNIIAVKGIDVSKLVGVWYQVERYFSIVEAFTSCTTATFGSNITKANELAHFPLTYQQKAA